jgi:hypothetical protein
MVVTAQMVVKWSLLRLMALVVCLVVCLATLLDALQVLLVVLC